MALPQCDLGINKNKFKKSDRPSRFKNSRSNEATVGIQPDQTLINEWILTQLDAIVKRLTAIGGGGGGGGGGGSMDIFVKEELNGICISR